MSAPPISNPFKDPLKTFTDIASLPYTTPKNLLGPAALAIGKSAGESLGISKSEEEKAQEASAAEEAARSAAYNESLTGGIDKISQQEIANLYQSGASSSSIANTLAAARSGKGIYAVRTLNQAKQEVSAKMPGRRATTRSLGYGSVL